MSEKSSKKSLFWVLLLAVVVIGALFLLGYIPHSREKAQASAAAQQEQSELPAVEVAQVKRASNSVPLMLPGNIMALIEAPIYSRAPGYVRKRYVALGDKVKEGQLLAEIEAPELDSQVSQGRAAVNQARQQLAQAQANLEQSKAQMILAKATNDRYATLVVRGAVSRQDADQQKATYDSSVATVNAQESNVKAATSSVNGALANLERLVTLQAYEKVRSPFDGLITARLVDVGALISGTGGAQGGANAAGSEMFRVAKLDKVRIFVNVPQSFLAQMHTGEKASIIIPELPQRLFPGLVAHMANSLDPATRTELVEIQAENKAHTMLPGMYAQVQFSEARANPPLLIPGASIISRAEGTTVAVLLSPDGQHGKARRVHMQKVSLGRDYGIDTEILSGLNGGEYVASSPSDDVVEGAYVLPSKATK